MNRAERRRQEKAAKKKKATYNLTKPMLDDMVKKEIEDELAAARQEGFYDGMNKALVLMLAIPMEVLMNDYWQKSFHTRIKGFMDKVIELYTAWQDGDVDIQDFIDDLWEYGGVKLKETEDDNDDEQGKTN